MKPNKPGAGAAVAEGDGDDAGGELLLTGGETLLLSSAGEFEVRPSSDDCSGGPALVGADPAAGGTTGAGPDAVAAGAADEEGVDSEGVGVDIGAWPTFSPRGDTPPPPMSIGKRSGATRAKPWYASWICIRYCMTWGRARVAAREGLPIIDCA